MRAFTAALIGVLLASCSTGSAAHGSVPTTLRLGYFPNVTHAATIVGVARGTFADALGDEAVLDAKTFPAVNGDIARITTKALPDAVVANAFKTTEFTTEPLPNSLQKAADSAFELDFLGTERPTLVGIWALEPLEAVVEARKKNRVASR